MNAGGERAIRRLDRQAVAAAVDHLVSCGWTWDTGGLTAFLAPLGVTPAAGDLPLLLLTSEALDSAAGSVQAAGREGPLFALTLGLTTVAEEGNQLAQAELDAAFLDANEVVSERLGIGQPRSDGSGVVWPLDGTELVLRRSERAVRLTLYHRYNRSIAYGEEAS